MSKRPYLKTVHTEIVTRIDQDGVVLGESITERKIAVGSSNDFYKVFIAIESVVLGMSLSEERVFRYCCLNCDRKNMITLNKGALDRIETFFECAPSSAKRAIKDLTERKLLLRISRAVYMVNPHYVCKTDEEKRKHLLKFSLTVQEI